MYRIAAPPIIGGGPPAGISPSGMPSASAEPPIRPRPSALSAAPFRKSLRETSLLMFVPPSFAADALPHFGHMINYFLVSVNRAGTNRAPRGTNDRPRIGKSVTIMV